MYGSELINPPTTSTAKMSRKLKRLIDISDDEGDAPSAGPAVGYEAAFNAYINAQAIRLWIYPPSIYRHSGTCRYVIARIGGQASGRSAF